MNVLEEWMVVHRLAQTQLDTTYVRVIPVMIWQVTDTLVMVSALTLSLNNIVRFSPSKGISYACRGMSSLYLYSYCYRDVSYRTSLF